MSSFQTGESEPLIVCGHRSDPRQYGPRAWFSVRPPTFAHLGLLLGAIQRDHRIGIRQTIGVARYKPLAHQHLHPPREDGRVAVARRSETPISSALGGPRTRTRRVPVAVPGTGGRPMQVASRAAACAVRAADWTIAWEAPPATEPAPCSWAMRASLRLIAWTHLHPAPYPQPPAPHRQPFPFNVAAAATRTGRAPWRTLQQRQRRGPAWTWGPAQTRALCPLPLFVVRRGPLLNSSNVPAVPRLYSDDAIALV
jgi:hypothetical protein